jgi:hypothetical protein
MSFSALVIPPAGDVYRRDVGSGKPLNELVGGWIEGVVCPSRPGVMLYVNEEGQRLNLEPNLRATILAGTSILGTAVAFGVEPGNPEEQDCPPDIDRLFPSFPELPGGAS